jgi:hypothetical protein
MHAIKESLQLSCCINFVEVQIHWFIILYTRTTYWLLSLNDNSYCFSNKYFSARLSQY